MVLLCVSGSHRLQRIDIRLSTDQRHAGDVAAELLQSLRAAGTL